MGSRHIIRQQQSAETQPWCPTSPTAALDLSGGDEKAMRAIEQRISAVLAEKSALESKLARVEENYKSEIEGLKAVRLLGAS